MSFFQIIDFGFYKKNDEQSFRDKINNADDSNDVSNEEKIKPVMLSTRELISSTSKFSNNKSNQIIVIFCLLS